MKRIISFFLMTALLFSLFPVVHAEVEWIPYPVTGGNIYISGHAVLDCDDTVTEAIVPSYVEGRAITSIGQNAFRYNKNLTRVVLPEGIDYVSSHAFQDCYSLTSVELPSTLKRLEERTFEGSGLTNLHLKYVEYIGTSCFEGCRKLKSVSFDSIEMISSEAFDECYELSSVTFPETLTYIYGRAFRQAALRSVVLPKSISYIGEDAFGMNLDLTRVTVLNPGCRYGYFDPGYPSAQIFHGLTTTTITYHGDENSSLRKYVEEHGGRYTAHNFNEDEICTICGAAPYTFDDGLWNFDSLSGIAYIYGCGEVAQYTALYDYYDWRYYNSCVKHIVLGNDVREVAAGAFSDMYMVETINLVNVEKIGNSAFENCTSFARLYTPDTLEEIGYKAFANCTGLLAVVLRPNVKEVGNYAFYGCSSLTRTDVLNPECELGIGQGDSTINTICSFIPSKAYDFAMQYGHPFYELNGCEYGYHNYALISETPAGCTSEGDAVYQCQNCTEGYTEAIPALGHSYEAQITEASCTEGGFTTYTCQNCADTYTADHAEAIGHDYETITHEASCTEGGYTEYNCLRCGDYYIAEQTEPKGHSYSAVTKVATCTEGGYTEYFCSGCADRYLTDYTEPLGHSYAVAVTVFPTCTESGYTEYFCPGCADGYIDDYTAPLGHSYGVSVTVAPTCTEGGYSEYSCTGCGDHYIADQTEPLGHRYSAGLCVLCAIADPTYKPVEIVFADVSSGSWYKGAVDYAVSNKLMVGTAKDRFEPETATTRAMLVTVLWRYVGQPLDGKNDFRDVPMGQWFTDAVVWAAHNGIVAGVGNGRFAPDASITREQLVTILYRYCNAVGIDTASRTDLNSFPDANEVSSYAREAMSWAVSVGLVSGTKLGGTIYLDPQGNATRAQVASILMRFIENIA